MTAGIDTTFTFGVPLMPIVELLKVTVDPVMVPILFDPTGSAAVICTSGVLRTFTLLIPTIENELLVIVTVVTLTVSEGMDWTMTVLTLTCRVLTVPGIVTLDPVIVPILFDPAGRADPRVTDGVFEMETGIDVPAGVITVIVDPVTESVEAVTVMLPIETVAVVFRGLPTVPISSPLLSRRFTCSARYFVMRKAAVVVLATGGSVSL